MSDQNPYSPPEADIDVPVEAELASRGARLLGAILDGVIAMLIIFPIFFLVGFFEAMSSGQLTPATSIWMGVIGMGIFLLINGYLLANYGQTVGKRIVGTQIVDYQNSRILSLGKIFLLRYLPFWVVGQIPLIGGIISLVNPLFIFGSERRCLHDYVAGTKVIYANLNRSAA